ncbi:MAG: hypothetical protein ACRDRS_07445 [Pseudonocardiaceae bacterium]
MAALRYPVPEVVEIGRIDGVHYFVERSAGGASLHDMALAETNDGGTSARTFFERPWRSPSGC